MREERREREGRVARKYEMSRVRRQREKHRGCLSMRYDNGRQ